MSRSVHQLFAEVVVSPVAAPRVAIHGDLQLLVEIILDAALDRIETCLPHAIVYHDRLHLMSGQYRNPKTLMAFEDGILAMASMSLASLFTKITGEGMAIDDALPAAGDFREKVKRLVESAWLDAGRNIAAKSKTSDGMEALYGSLWPNVREHAGQFVQSFLSCQKQSA